MNRRVVGALDASRCPLFCLSATMGAQCRLSLTVSRPRRQGGTRQDEDQFAPMLAWRL
jgi:hypothetical protein